ncbi:hypothetical protein N1851_029912 [Merluccius polli]|uniref:Uncharacterized protein n=1 Tax=Merluccius polli TaxID=89951 RepID=A0AA47M6C5_MERPO|nr:hypothetical protein N1851_029912 [Merluccius polli]
MHGILPRITWPLLFYEVIISTVEGLERRVSRFQRKWLGLPQSLIKITLYGKNNMLNEESMVTHTREVLQYQESSDPKVSQAGIQVRTGHKGKAAEAVMVTESWLRPSALVSMVACGRVGLGSGTKPCYDKTKTKDRRATIMEEAVYDILLSPSNLHIWGKVESPAHPLCQQRGTLENTIVTKSSRSSLTPSAVESTIRPLKKTITFIRAVQRQQQTSSSSLLSTAQDWELKVDLGKQLKFPENVAVTTLRLDMVLLSEATKQVILTVPWEERIEEANKRKIASKSI